MKLIKKLKKKTRLKTETRRQILIHCSETTNMQDLGKHSNLKRWLKSGTKKNMTEKWNKETMKKNYQLRNTFEPPIFLNSSPCFFPDQDGKDITFRNLQEMHQHCKERCGSVHDWINQCWTKVTAIRTHDRRQKPSRKLRYTGWYLNILNWF